MYKTFKILFRIFFSDSSGCESSSNCAVVVVSSSVESELSEGGSVKEMISGMNGFWFFAKDSIQTFEQSSSLSVTQPVRKQNENIYFLNK